MSIETLSNIQNEQSILTSAFTKEGLMLLKDLKVRPNEFYSSNHQVLYKAILETYSETDNIDPILVLEHCKKNKILNAVGGTSYITEIATNFTNNIALNNYVDILREYKLKRDILDISKNIEEKQNIEANELLNVVQIKFYEFKKLLTMKKHKSSYGKNILKVKKKHI